MASKILSIEIGAGLARVVEMDYGSKNPRVYNCFSFEVPQDVVADGKVAVNDTFNSLFRTECGKRGISTKDAVFSVTSTRITSREARIPQVKEKKINETVMANVADYFPGDLTQFTIVIGDYVKEETALDKQWKINLLAVPKDIISSYFEFCDSLGLNLVALDYVGNSVYQVVKQVFLTGTNIVLKVDERATMITYLRAGKVDFQRIITYGVEDAIHTVMDSDVYGNDLTYGQAIEVLCGKTCIRRYLNPESDYVEEEDVDADTRETREEITESLRYLVGNIARVMDYYKSKNEDVTIDSVALLGLGGDFSGLSKLLTNELNHTVKVFNNVSCVNVSKEAYDASSTLTAATYAACMGAGFAPENLIPAEQQKAKGKKGKSKNNTMIRESAVTIGAAFLIIGLLASVFMIGYSLISYSSVKRQVAKVQTHIDQLEAEGVEAVYNEYTTVKGLNDRLNEIYGATQSRNEDLVAFLDELEEKLPSEMTIVNFAATHDSVSISFECENKEAAARTMMQLRTFDSVEYVSSESLTHDQEENIVAFTVNMTYKAVGVDETAESEAN